MHATREFGYLFKKAGYSTFLSASAVLAAINCYFLGGLYLYPVFPGPKRGMSEGYCRVDPCQGGYRGWESDYTPLILAGK